MSINNFIIFYIVPTFRVGTHTPDAPASSPETSKHLSFPRSSVGMHTGYFTTSMSSYRLNQGIYLHHSPEQRGNVYPGYSSACTQDAERLPGRSHALRGNAYPGHSQDAGASLHAFPRRAWERSGSSVRFIQQLPRQSTGFIQRLPDRSAGFTLIEVLVAMLVLALGLLGLAGLQASALKNNQSAYYRSQATQLAYDIADRMRANLTEAKKFNTSQYDSDVLSPASAANQSACTTVANTCTPAQMAQQDIFEWYGDVTSFLPMGQATINASGSLYTVTINWDDNHDGNVNNNDPNFVMSFQL